jgi:group I intron endonuclease
VFKKAAVRARIESEVAELRPGGRYVGVYVLRSESDGKVYVGCSADLTTRICRHAYALRCGWHHSKHLQAAWVLYGEENFSFEILEFCSEELLDEREEMHQMRLRSRDPAFGYNGVPGGSRRKGYRHSGETKQKIREAALRRSPPSAETRRRLGESRRGVPSASGWSHSEETKERHFSERKGRRLSPEARSRVAEASRRRAGWSHSEEAKEKIGAAQRGKAVSDETRRKLREAWVRRRARPQSEEDIG